MITIFKIKKGKEKKLQRWFSDIQKKHYIGAKKSITFEGIKREAVTIVKIEKFYYAIFYSEGKMKRRSYDPLSIKHREIMKEHCHLPPEHYDFLYNISSRKN